MEYGYLSAFQRTELFTKAYEEEFRRKHAQYFDSVEAERMQPIDAKYVKNSAAEMTALWHARQHADQIGVPYPFFIRAAIELAIQRWTKKRVPRPNQLWRESQLAAIRRAWNEEYGRRTFMPSPEWDLRFLAQKYRGDPAQLACLDIIERDVYRAGFGNQAARLSAYLHDKRMITEDESRRRFGDDLTEEALAARDDLPVVAAPTANAPYRAPCIGLVEARDSPACSECPFAAACEKASGLAKRDLVARRGSDDPRRAKIRADTAIRVRRLREKRRSQDLQVAGDTGTPGCVVAAAL
ncbi:hypothetical protein AB4Y64_02780 [Lysobacter sp. TAF61]